MSEIVALLQSIAPVVSLTVWQQMSQVIYGLLISNGCLTMLEISRWTEGGGSCRTIEFNFRDANSIGVWMIL